ncbi:sigma 54-interacting transcriptional regulator, partial [Klebsiella pneumoniae]|nr:sigma 54-interacting transcriptional regulator [Klebsiella pneumoniae]
LDVRIISATHRDLARMAEEGTFREDLYYRLNVVPIALPPLRDRREDIEALVLHFLGMAQEEGLPGKRIDPDAVALLRLHEWRGNVR